MKMRVSREQAAGTRERVVDTAARMFRQKGFDGIGLDAIMRDAGLTHGGFYRHFKSKDDLAAEAVECALRRSEDRQSRFEALDEFVADYLSDRHFVDRANGCAFAALGSDIARQSDGVRRGFTAHLRTQLERIGDLLKGGSAASKRKRAIATLSGIVGALTLARAVNDPTLSEEIRAAARDIFSGLEDAS
jgi:TetR/AcrR family transcriptional repressor of nem operon